MPLQISTQFGSPDLDGLDPSGNLVGVASGFTSVNTPTGTDYIVSGGEFSQSLATATSGDITDVPISDFNYANNVITYQLDSATEGLLPTPTTTFGGQVLGYDPTDQIYLVNQYAGFTPVTTGDPNTNTFVASGFTPHHLELIGLCGSGAENTALCTTAANTDIGLAYAANGDEFVFSDVPEPASGSILMAAMGLAYVVGRLRRGGARRS